MSKNNSKSSSSCSSNSNRSSTWLATLDQSVNQVLVQQVVLHRQSCYSGGAAAARLDFDAKTQCCTPSTATLPVTPVTSSIRSRRALMHRMRVRPAMNFIFFLSLRLLFDASQIAARRGDHPKEPASPPPVGGQ